MNQRSDDNDSVVQREPHCQIIKLRGRFYISKTQCPSNHLTDFEVAFTLFKSGLNHYLQHTTVCICFLLSCSNQRMMRWVMTATNTNFHPYCSHSGLFNMPEVRQKKKGKKNETVDESSNGSTPHQRNSARRSYFGKPIKVYRQPNKALLFSFRARERGDNDDDNRAKVVETWVALI